MTRFLFELFPLLKQITFNAVISACEKSKALHQAFDVFAAMLRQSVKADTVSYNAFTSACEKAEKLRLFAQILKGSPRALFALLQATAHTENSWEAAMKVGRGTVRLSAGITHEPRRIRWPGGLVLSVRKRDQMR